MRVPDIWAFAQAIRRQVLRSSHCGIVDVCALAERTARVSINDIAFRLVWDFEHGVHDENGRTVIGVCEYDPQEPGQVMLSINGEKTGRSPELKRSTALHELGHALFDMPAAVHAGRRCCLEFARAQAQRMLRVRTGSRVKGMDWQEWRANEFMGAFLAPPVPFHQTLVRLANEADMQLVNSPSFGKIGLPILRGNRLDQDAFDAVLEFLAETFGVTQEFARVRITKYRLMTERTH